MYSSPKPQLAEQAELKLKEEARKRAISLSHRDTSIPSNRERFSSRTSALIALIVIFIIVASFIIFYRYIL